MSLISISSPYSSQTKKQPTWRQDSPKDIYLAEDVDSPSSTHSPGVTAAGADTAALR